MSAGVSVYPQVCANPERSPGGVDSYEGVLLGFGLIVIGVVVLFLVLILIDRRGR